VESRKLGGHWRPVRRCLALLAAVAGSLSLLTCRAAPPEAAGPPDTAVLPEATRGETVTSPYLERLELVTNDADTNSDNGGNAWGNNKLRIQRSSAGDIFVVYPAGGAAAWNKPWILMHRPPIGGWSEMARGAGGRESPNLLIGPGDRLSLFTQPNGLPDLVKDAGRNGLLPFTPTPMPGSWYGTAYPYAGATVRNDNGDLFFVETQAENLSPSAFYWSYRSTDTGMWHPIMTQNTSFRYTYFLPLASTTGGTDFAIAASTDVLWSNLGYKQPPRSFDYVYDRVSLFYTDNYRNAGLTEKLIYQEQQKQNAYLHVFANDAYRDPQRRVHVIYSVQGPSTNQHIVAHHAVVQGATIVADVALPGVSCGNEGRIFQDATGQYYLLTYCGTSLYLWPADSADGTQVGQPVIMDVSQYPPDTWLWLGTVRGGTPLDNVVDGVYSSANGRQLVYFRVQLRPAA